MLNTLPNELIYCILDNLSLCDYANLAKCDKYLNYLVNTNELFSLCKDKKYTSCTTHDLCSILSEDADYLQYMKRFYLMYWNHVNASVLFYNACIKDNLEVAKYLFEHAPSIKEKDDLEEIFTDTCISGAINILYWFITEQIVNTKMRNQHKNFILACRNGRIDVAEILWETCAFKNNIICDAFVEAARRGHTCTLKWLNMQYELIGNITDTTFILTAHKTAKKKNQYHVLKWFHKTFPHIKFIE